MFIPCFTNNRMIAPTLFLYASFLICFVFRVQNNFSWLWEHWQPQLELRESCVPAVASCALCRGPSPTQLGLWLPARPPDLPIHFTFACCGHLGPQQVAMAVASFPSNPRGCSQSFFYRYKKEDAGDTGWFYLPLQL